MFSGRGERKPAGIFYPVKASGFHLHISGDENTDLLNERSF